MRMPTQKKKFKHWISFRVLMHNFARLGSLSFPASLYRSPISPWCYKYGNNIPSQIVVIRAHCCRTWKTYFEVIMRLYLLSFTHLIAACVRPNYWSVAQKEAHNYTGTQWARIRHIRVNTIHCSCTAIFSIWQHPDVGFQLQLYAYRNVVYL